MIVSIHPLTTDRRNWQAAIASGTAPRTFERRATATAVSASAMLFVLVAEQRHGERRHQPPLDE